MDFTCVVSSCGLRCRHLLRSQAPRPALQPPLQRHPIVHRVTCDVVQRGTVPIILSLQTAWHKSAQAQNWSLWIILHVVSAPVSRHWPQPSQRATCRIVCTLPSTHVPQPSLHLRRDCCRTRAVNHLTKHSTANVIMHTCRWPQHDLGTAVQMVSRDTSISLEASLTKHCRPFWVILCAFAPAAPTT